MKIRHQLCLFMVLCSGGSAWAVDADIAASLPTGPCDKFLHTVAENQHRGQLLLSGRETPDRRQTFLLKGGQPLAVVFNPSPRGLIDGTLTLVSPHAAVSFAGLVLDVEEHPVLRSASSIVPRDYHVEIQEGRAVHVHRLEINGKPVQFEITLWTEGDGLRIGWACDRRMTDLCLGDTDRRPNVVWFGHGYRVEQPKTAYVKYRGQDLATSHIAADYEGGLSVLQAMDTPPDGLEINPDRPCVSLHGHQGGTFTLLAGEEGGMDCALRYRALCGKQASDGVATLAGRFVVDLWGGSFKNLDTQMRHAIHYGLTNAAVLVHVWQRWGYDNRLPDIWPPDPELGGLNALRTMAEDCRRAGVLWGLHDNYRSFYPDATGFSLDHVAHDSQGQPIKSWFNKKHQAQGYEWNPTHIMPFLERNVALIEANLHPTCGYLDTLANKPPFDFYDRAGHFHSALETREAWRRAFVTYRRAIGGPMMSEAGDDSLIGYLDGAQCQFVPIIPNEIEHRIQLPCAKWERVPWFDAVYHDRFIQSGVGSALRFGGKSNCAATDDYLSLEILTGHALMVTRPLLVRDAIRKYWLAQPVAHALALRQIRSWQMDEGDMRRQLVIWDGGTQVWVNRGSNDWVIAGRTLPQFGFLVKCPAMETAIERRGGVVCERRESLGDWYCNARGGDKAKMVDFEFAATDGGLRLERTDRGLRVTPLPDSSPFQARLRLKKLGWPQATTASVLAVKEEELTKPPSQDAQNNAKANDLPIQDGELVVRHDGKSFSYEIRLDSR